MFTSYLFMSDKLTILLNQKTQKQQHQRQQILWNLIFFHYKTQKKTKPRNNEKTKLTSIARHQTRSNVENNTETSVCCMMMFDVYQKYQNNFETKLIMNGRVLCAAKAHAQINCVCVLCKRAFLFDSMNFRLQPFKICFASFICLNIYVILRTSTKIWRTR